MIRGRAETAAVCAWLALLAGCGDSSSPEGSPGTPSIRIAKLEPPPPFDPRGSGVNLAVSAEVSGVSHGFDAYTVQAEFAIWQGGGIPVRTLTDTKPLAASGRVELGALWDGSDRSGRPISSDAFAAFVTLSLYRKGEVVATKLPPLGAQTAACDASAGCVRLSACYSADTHPEACETALSSSQYLCSLIGGFKPPPPLSSWNFSGTDDSPPIALPFATSPSDRYPANAPAGGNPGNTENPVVVGTDLGSPFEVTAADGTSKIYFLFGDTEPVADRSYAHDTDGNIFPTGSPFKQLTANDDSLGVSEQAATDPPIGPERCIDVSFRRGSSELDPVQLIPKNEFIDPVTLDGPLTADLKNLSVSGINLGVLHVPGPGFSIDGRVFALMPATSEFVDGIACDSNMPCPQDSNCLIAWPNQPGRCYAGDCSALDGSKPCFKRNAPATLAVSDDGGPAFRSLLATEFETSADGTRTALDIYDQRADIIPPVAFYVPDSGQIYAWGRNRILGHPDNHAELYFWKHAYQAGPSGKRIGLPSVFAGCDDDPAICDSPKFSSSESDAKPVYDEDRLIINQTSITYLPNFGRWVMIYGGRLPFLILADGSSPALTLERTLDAYAGIYLRTAAHPWGPWSSPITIYNPYWSNVDGYCELLHLSPDQASMLDERIDPSFVAASCDPESAMQKDSSRPAGEFGAEYGTAIVPRFTEDSADHATLYWLMSTWYPYRVVVMKTVLSKPATPGK